MPNYTIKSLLQEAANDAKGLAESKLELLQLKLTDKGATTAANGIYGAILFIIVRILVALLLICGGFAFALLFAQSDATLEIIRALLFGFLCASGVLLLTLLIMLAVKNSFRHSVRSKVINQMLDQLEEKERAKIAELNQIIAESHESEFEASSETPTNTQANE